MKLKPLLLFFLTFTLFLFGCQTTKQTELTIMSYNIKHGEGMDKVQDLNRSLEIVKTYNPDLLALQEIDHKCERSGMVDQAQFFAEATASTGTFGKFMDYNGGQYGMATIIKPKIISTKVLPIPRAKYETRSVIIQELELENGIIIAFANVHFEWISGAEGEVNRLNQAKAVIDYLNTLNRPTIITGDFNCTPDSPTMLYFEKEGFTFVEKGSDNLSFQGEEKSEIDHLIYRAGNHTYITIKDILLVVEPVVSDHRPLIVKLEIRK